RKAHLGGPFSGPPRAEKGRGNRQNQNIALQISGLRKLPASRSQECIQPQHAGTQPYHPPVSSRCPAVVQPLSSQALNND
ncbi:MAG: hypothetical protein IJQ14_07860, partial [Bacteroidales bacterium]|nr:hypothetical protein [Bacteroidales bacterium]